MLQQLHQETASVTTLRAEYAIVSLISLEILLQLPWQKLATFAGLV